MIDRILLLLKIKNLTASKFAEEIGIQRSNMSHIMSGRNLPSLDLIMKILKTYPDINSEWLIQGVGQMFKTNQIDLFAQTNELKLSPLQEEISTQIPVETKNFDSQEVEESKIEVEMPIQKTVQEVLNTTKETKTPIESKSKIEKIIVFYEDGTFKSYNPA